MIFQRSKIAKFFTKFSNSPRHSLTTIMPLVKPSSYHLRKEACYTPEITTMRFKNSFVQFLNTNQLCNILDINSNFLPFYTYSFFIFILFLFFIIFYFYFIITLGIHLQYSYTVLTYNKTTKFTYVTALLLTCLLLTYIKIPKTSLQQTKGLLKTINK